MLRLGRLELGWGFFAMAALAVLAGAESVLPAVVLAALCHEAGHLAALSLTGARVERVRLTAFGAEICADTRFMPYGRELICTLAGPAANLLLALVLARWGHRYLAAGANLLLGCFNLLPAPSLDGGRALYLLVSWMSGPPLADTVCKWVGLLTGSALTACAAVLTLRHQAGLFLLLGALGTLLPQIITLFPVRRQENL